MAKGDKLLRAASEQQAAFLFLFGVMILLNGFSRGLGVINPNIMTEGKLSSTEYSAALTGPAWLMYNFHRIFSRKIKAFFCGMCCGSDQQQNQQKNKNVRKTQGRRISTEIVYDSRTEDEIEGDKQKETQMQTINEDGTKSTKVVGDGTTGKKVENKSKKNAERSYFSEPPTVGY